MTTPTPTININHRIATYEGPPLVGENEKYKLTFTFDEEWEGTIKTARFVWNRKFHDVWLDEHDQCEIPPFPSNAKLIIGVYSDTGLTSSAVAPLVCDSIKDGAIVPQPVVEVEVPQKWKLIKTINLMEQEENFEENTSAGLVEIGDGLYAEFSIRIWDLYAYLEDITGLTHIVLPLPFPAAPTDRDPVDSFTVFMQYWLMGGGENDTHYYRADRMTVEIIESLSSTVEIPTAANCNPSMTGFAVCYVRQNDDGTFTPPSEWNLEIYQIDEVPLP